MSDLRESSKKSWRTSNTIDHINAGSLQRIADATEKMASNYTMLQVDNEWLKKANLNKINRIEALERSNAALRGVITKMKRKAENND